ncbi:hypothetical protein [Psychrobacter sp. LV10R520-6]|uniref:hypothetical protein n=1 Tax=Psychrobacter sp. LV10R520-6 TaxID=1415574 RepID=UPI002AA0B5A1|nr:hypothetical protein [Psychrobacter sp. LV10R520-6]
MSSSIHSRLSKRRRLLKSKYQLNDVKNRKATKTTFALIIAALSFSVVGCSTLQALEPTAILISDIKNSL